MAIHFDSVLAFDAGYACIEAPPLLLDDSDLSANVLIAPFDPEHPPGSLNTHDLFQFFGSVFLSLAAQKA